MELPMFELYAFILAAVAGLATGHAPAMARSGRSIVVSGGTSRQACTQ